MRQVILVIVSFIVLASVAACTQTPKVDKRADEAAIRKLAMADEPKTTDDEIFWSGAYPRPMVKGKGEIAPFPELRTEQRRNEKTTWEIVRLDVAEGGDMAYEFANATLSYDMADTKENVSFPTSALGVWKKVNGEWRRAAWFQRPLDTPFQQIGAAK